MITIIYIEKCMDKDIARSQLGDELLAAFQTLSEYDLTQRVILPLLRSFGYQRVEYHGGPTEEGKDAIGFRIDELGDDELIVAQIKKYRSHRKASDLRSFSELVTQLSQAAEKKLPNISGRTYLPSIIYFITPFRIDANSLKSRFEGVVLSVSVISKLSTGHDLWN